MRTELVTLADERGIPIYFVDTRTAAGSLIDSRFFETELAAREYLATGGEDRCVA